jgi:hypothetical protein
MGVPNPQPRLGTKRQKKDGKNNGGNNRTGIHVESK